MNKKLLLVFLLLSLALLPGIALSSVPTINSVDIYTVPSGSPERIAADSEGKIYVTDNQNGLVRVFSNNGLHLNNLSITGSPIGIAVDQFGKLYISDRKKKNVGVYDAAGNLFFKLGIGNSEFILPNDIAVSGSGRVYVTDSKANVVKVYSTANGSPLGTFGSGLLNFPAGIAIDDGTGEVFVIDYNHQYIRVYDLNGNLIRSIKGSGGGGMMSSSKILAPLGIAVDATRIYVSDAFHSVVAVYDRGTGAFFKYIGNYGSGITEFKTPAGLVIDKDKKLFVANSNNLRIDVLGIDTYNNLKISPSELAFSVYAKGPSVTQPVSLSSDLNNTTWSASVPEQWVSVLASSGPTPSSVDVTVDPAAVLPGNYNVDVKFSTSSGMVSLLKLKVEVNMPVLSVAPSSLNLTYQKNSPVFPSGTLLINSIGAALSWSGSTTAEWLTLDNATGTTPSSTGLSVSSSISGLEPGTYTASVGIDAGANVIGSPASANVTLNIIEAGDIKIATNLDASTFTITGPQSFSGGGEAWTETNANTGTYVVSFGHVSGYTRPYSRSFTVESGRTTEINAEYLKKKTDTHVIVGSDGEKGNELAVFTLTGEKVFSTVPFDDPQSVRVAAGDLDNSGTDKIVVTDYGRSLKVYSFEGTELASLSLSKSYANADIAVGDIDNDGKADILVAVSNSKIIGEKQRRAVKVFNYSDGQIQEKAVLFIGKIRSDFTIALGDVNGDGMLELILAASDNIRAFSINVAESKLTQIWTVKTGSKDLPRIAAGDIDDDGIDEIGLSITQVSKKEKDPVIRILNGSGEEYGITIDAFGDLGYAMTSSICIGDIDGDGIDEIAAGAGLYSHNKALIRFFESDGTFTGTVIGVTDKKAYSVNIGMGHFVK